MVGLVLGGHQEKWTPHWEQPCESFLESYRLGRLRARCSDSFLSPLLLRKSEALELFPSWERLRWTPGPANELADSPQYLKASGNPDLQSCFTPEIVFGIGRFEVSQCFRYQLLESGFLKLGYNYNYQN